MPRRSAVLILRFLLRSVVRFCLRQSLHLQDIVEAAKVVFIEEAERALSRNGEKVNVSRLSIVSGMHRRDVVRLYREHEAVDEPQGLLSRIIGQWQYDRRFCTRAGKGREISCEGDENEFQKLVRSVSSDLNPGTVLFELERLRAIRRTRKGVKLDAESYVPKGDFNQGFGLLATDLDDLTRSVEENVTSGDIKHLHGTTQFDNIRPSALPLIRKWLLSEGAVFHKRAREFLAQFDRDINPKSDKQPGVRVALGTYSFVDRDGGGAA